MKDYMILYVIAYIIGVLGPFFGNRLLRERKENEPKNWISPRTTMGFILLLVFPALGILLNSSANELKRETTIKSILDHKTLELLQQLNGLMMARSNWDIDTIQFLMQQGIIKNEIFPSNKKTGEPITCGYYPTPFGRRVLSILKIKTFEDIICEMHRICSWENYRNGGYFSQQIDNFRKDFGRDYNQSIEQVIKYIPEDFANTIVSNDGYLRKLYIFSHYYSFGNYTFDDKEKVINASGILNPP